MKILSLITLLLGLFVSEAGGELIPSHDMDGAECALKAARLIENTAAGAVIFPSAPGSCPDFDDSLNEELKIQALPVEPVNGFVDRGFSAELATRSGAVDQ